MPEKNKSNMGFYTVLINLILILFLLTDEKSDPSYGVVAVISSFIAIVFSVFLLHQTKKKISDSISLVINIIIFSITLLYVLKKYFI